MLEEYNKPRKTDNIEKKPLNFLDTNTNNPEKPAKKNKKSFFILAIFIILFSILIIRTFSSPAISENPYEYDPITLEPKMTV